MIIVDIREFKDYEYKTFFQQGLRAHPDKFRISVEDEAQEPFPTDGLLDSFTLGVIDNSNQLHGVVSFRRSEPNRSKLRHKGLLFRMYVKASSAGKGLGMLLIRELMHRIGQLGDIEQINLTVIQSNTKAIAFYKSFGFEVFAQERKAIKLDKKTYLDELQMAYYFKKSEL